MLRAAGLAVETGLRNWSFTEIVDGLEEGDRVVVSLDRAEVAAWMASSTNPFW